MGDTGLPHDFGFCKWLAPEIGKGCPQVHKSDWCGQFKAVEVAIKEQVALPKKEEVKAPPQKGRWR